MTDAAAESNGRSGQASVSSRCCIVGGGPAGMMLGYLLSRAGVEVAVLEKHGDFLRDFRGDTIHPSTLELMYELGILEEFLQRPHQEAREIRAVIGEREYQIADFSHLPTQCKFVALMPQWDFLDFIKEHAAKYPGFHLYMRAEATELVEENGRVVGVRAKTPDGVLEVRAPLTVAADGRHSTLRQQANLTVEDLGAPIDVLWMRIARTPGDPDQLVGRINDGRMFVMIDRRDYWQCGFIIHKGGYDEVRARGLEAFHREIVAIAPFLQGRLGELDDWAKIKLLTVVVDRLQHWSRPGLLCIGDAAHAMSPVGGVGINLAIQDAVATANLLAEPLRTGAVTQTELDRVQNRREPAARRTQGLQVFIHRRFLSRIIGRSGPTTLPWYVRLILRIPRLKRIPARVFGVGFVPEHIATPDVMAGNSSVAK